MFCYIDATRDLLKVTLRFWKLHSDWKIYNFFLIYIYEANILCIEVINKFRSYNGVNFSLY